MVKTKKNKKNFQQVEMRQARHGGGQRPPPYDPGAPDRIGAKKMQFKPYGGLNCIFFVPVPRPDLSVGPGVFYFMPVIPRSQTAARLGHSAIG